MTEEIEKRGGKRPGAGRKKGSFIGEGPKTGRIVVACTKEEEEKIKDLAKEAGVSISRFIVDSILKS